MLHQKALKAVYITMGVVSLAVGIVGVFTPLLPTTPFVLFAAWCFSRSNERFHAWILNHKMFGPVIENWRRDRAVPMRVKILAVAMLALSAWIVGRKEYLAVWVRASAVLSCAGVAVFISTRKTARPRVTSS